jgi:A/G-specific adenine glycosylase
MQPCVKLLLSWDDQETRDLPWRRCRDPYAIWISEIMLQQTRVETVRDYYRRWMERFPDIKSLAQADVDTVLKMWEGLGYYTRARNLHKAARLMVEASDGNFPSSYLEILALPGIGSYTAGAVASIAFDQPTPAVDGNVLRVMSRLFALPDIAQPDVQAAIKTEVAEGFPDQRAGDYTQALMELGALVCVPRRPLCERCPLIGLCQAFAQNAQGLWPLVKEKKPGREVKRLVAVIPKVMPSSCTGDSLPDCWPVYGNSRVEGSRKQELAVSFAEEFGMQLKVGQHVLDAIHVFTHLQWQMKVYEATLVGDADLSGHLISNGSASMKSSNWLSPPPFKKIKQRLQ